MKTHSRWDRATALPALFLLVATLSGHAATVRYVNVNSPNPTAPFTDWATAATSIQDAVDAAVAGDTVLATNGIYAAGGRAVYGAMTNRVAIEKAITVRSVNGPTVTWIVGQGAGGAGANNGDGAVRCAYVGASAVLSGFTLTNGHTRAVGDYTGERSGGGAWCEMSSVVTNCVLIGNLADSSGGGAYRGTLNNCTLTGNSTPGSGGGAYDGTLNNCTLTGNAASYGGGAFGGRLNNCTLTGNSTGYLGGGAYYSTLNNCIAYYNSSPYGYDNYSQGDEGCTLNYCCTTPLPPGPGNLVEEPQLVDGWRLIAGSPCLGRGSAIYARGVDMDGEPWSNPPSIGCDEYWSGSVTGPFSVAVVAAHTNVMVGFRVDFQAVIEGRVARLGWDFGDGMVASNRTRISHAWAAAGDYVVELRAYNDNHPAGVAATVSVHVVLEEHFVALTSTNPTPPYTTWATAATNIQDAVDAATLTGALVWVSNGLYQTGGRTMHGMNNRVEVTKPVTVRSVNGPSVTQIKGYQVPGTTNGPEAVRCVYLTNGALLSGFTLTNGATQTSGDYFESQSGGGVWCEGPSAVVSNCVLAGNSAYCCGGGAHSGTLVNCTLTGNSAAAGGGAYYGTLNNCVLTGNSASWEGGGACSFTLNNCTLTGNSAGSYGGGASGGTLNNCTLTGNSAGVGGGVVGTVNNCIVFYNSAGTSGANYSGGTVNYSCTTPLPAAGTGNLADDPQLASASHLSAGSPCIGRGSSTNASGLDIDGEPWASPPSIGCDEYWSGSVTGAISVAAVAAYTNVAVGFPVDFQAEIGGRVSASRWSFGDGIVMSNRPYATHAWAAAGDYVVELRAYNDNHPAGVAATVMVHVVLEEHFVALSSTNPTPPYTTWATAATNIQDAVDVATLPGALVLVTNGVYQTGAQDLWGSRVAVTKPVAVRSVNGPSVTQIKGYQVPGTTNGPEAVRCVYLANGAVLAGFTLTNGATDGAGGGVACEGASAVVFNCVLTGNSAYYGGGAFFGTLNNCTLTGNSADYQGGGAWRGTLNNCLLTGNSARNGGGASLGSLNNCTLTGNSANYGGGVYDGTLNNCIVFYNSARYGGANYAHDDDDGGVVTLDFCCTTPLPVAGIGNLADDPQLASASHLSAGSPCIGRGSSTNASGLDIDGEPWASPPSIGCDEYWSGSATGANSVAFVAAYTNAAVGFPVDFQAVIGGRANASHWNFGDGSAMSNRPYATHAWAAAGDYMVELRAYNDNHPAGVAATVSVHVVLEEHFVALTSTNPTPPYITWATAATNVQDAVDAAIFPGALVWVSNGVYQTGARALDGLSNRVALTKPVTVRSVNGPAVTSIVGTGPRGPAAVRCAYLTNGAVLAGFTLTNGATQTSGDWSRNRSGGGVWCEGLSAVVSDCVLIGNSASWGGGGARYATLNNCALIGNSAEYGGGAQGGSLNNCTLMGNSADYGGGVYNGTLANCIVFYNSAQTSGANYEHHDDADGRLDFCCTTPLPAGTGNLIDEPSSVNTNGWSDLRLQSNSPCINAGNNDYASDSNDLDGNPRIVGGTVDIGAYEFPSPASQLSYAWLQQYGLAADGSADFADPDGDRANNWQEWKCATVPTNALSALRLLTPQMDGPNLVVRWQSVSGLRYRLERSTDLGTNASFFPLATNITGQAGTTPFTDTNAAAAGSRFYRVVVQ